MNEADKKFLTEKVLGECWHDMYEVSDYTYEQCIKCGVLTGMEMFRDDNDNRTFATDADVMDLMRAMVKQGKWAVFFSYAMCEYERVCHNWQEGYDYEYAEWLFLSTEPDGVRTFCKLAGEFYKEDE